MALQASSKVKGLTIEIGADITSFGYAMRQIRSEATTVSKDLKTIDNALKLDPQNIERAADKLKLLRESADNATKKVETIKKAIDALNKEFSDKSSKEYTDQLAYLERQLESANREQEVANARLAEYQRTADVAGKSSASLADIIKGNLTSSVIMAGLSKLASLAKTIARELAQVAKELFNFSKEAVGMAAQYEDALGYSEQLFGPNAEGMQKWVEDNSVALRIAQADLLVYANDLGTAFNALGLGSDQAVEFTENILSLSADIRAATGKDIGEINAALTRGFTSSLRNFRQFGVFVGEADVKIQALKSGVIEYTGDQEYLAEVIANVESASQKASEAMAQYGEDSAQFAEAEALVTQAEEELNAVLGQQEVELTGAERAAAVYELVMGRLGFLIGQNEEEAHLYNSQINAMKTTFANLKLEIGQQLLPVLTELITKFNEFLKSDEGQTIMNKIVETFKEWAKTISDMMDDGRLSNFVNELIDKLPTIVDDVGKIINKIIELAPKVAEIAEDAINIMHAIASPTEYVGSGVGWENTGRREYGRAGGGPVKAGQMYRVNDDAGRRIEGFVPYQDGYILSGDKMDRIINNNNQRTYGDVNVYVNSYGTNASAIANEIGIEVNKKLRMSGARL